MDNLKDIKGKLWAQDNERSPATTFRRGGKSFNIDPGDLSGSFGVKETDRGKPSELDQELHDHAEAYVLRELESSSGLRSHKLERILRIIQDPEAVKAYGENCEACAERPLPHPMNRWPKRRVNG